MAHVQPTLALTAQAEQVALVALFGLCVLGVACAVAAELSARVGGRRFWHRLGAWETRRGANAIIIAGLPWASFVVIVVDEPETARGGAGPEEALDDTAVSDDTAVLDDTVGRAEVAWLEELWQLPAATARNGRRTSPQG